MTSDTTQRARIHTRARAYTPTHVTQHKQTPTNTSSYAAGLHAHTHTRTPARPHQYRYVRARIRTHKRGQCRCMRVFVYAPARAPTPTLTLEHAVVLRRVVGFWLALSCLSAAAAAAPFLAGLRAGAGFWREVARPLDPCHWEVAPESTSVHRAGNGS